MIIIYVNIYSHLESVQLLKNRTLFKYTRDGCIECQQKTKLFVQQRPRSPKSNFGRFLDQLDIYHDSVSGRFLSSRQICRNPIHKVKRQELSFDPENPLNTENGNSPVWDLQITKPVTDQKPLVSITPKVKFSESYSKPNDSQEDVNFLSAALRHIITFTSKLFAKEEVCLQCNKHRKYVFPLSSKASLLKDFLQLVHGSSTERNLRENICKIPTPDPKQRIPRKGANIDMRLSNVNLSNVNLTHVTYQNSVFNKLHEDLLVNNVSSLFPKKTVKQQLLYEWDNLTAANSTAANSMADSSTTDNSTADNSMADDLTTDNSMADDLTADNLLADNLTADDSTADNSMADDLLADNLLADNLTADNSTTDNSAADFSTVDNSTTDNSIADSPISGNGKKVRATNLKQSRSRNWWTLFSLYGKLLSQNPTSVVWKSSVEEELLIPLNNNNNKDNLKNHLAIQKSPQPLLKAKLFTDQWQRRYYGGKPFCVLIM